MMMSKKEKDSKGAKQKKGSKGDTVEVDFPAAERGAKLGKIDTDVKGADPKAILKSVDDKMKKTLESTKGALAAIRTGRPSPNILDKVMVPSYGSESPLPQLASVQVSSATTIVVEPFDKSVLKDIEKALLASDLGMTPNSDGSVIRLNVPSLTTETRQKYLKQAKTVTEDGKVALRNIRRTGVDAVKKLEKDKTVSEDTSSDTQDQIQKLTDRFTKDLDALCEAKEKELAKV